MKRRVVQLCCDLFQREVLLEAGNQYFSNGSHYFLLGRGLHLRWGYTALAITGFNDPFEHFQDGLFNEKFVGLLRPENVVDHQPLQEITSGSFGMSIAIVE
jgi:hypothetical protein